MENYYLLAYFALHTFQKNINMKKSLLAILSICILIICTSSDNIASAYNDEALPNQPKDTIISYLIENISTEGTNADVRYINGKIKSAEVLICMSMGQMQINYTFYPDTVEVQEIAYSYTKPIDEVRSKADFFKEYELKYQIDYNGKRIKILQNISHSDFFIEFKKVVPFDLNSQASNN